MSEEFKKSVIKLAELIEFEEILNEREKEIDARDDEYNARVIKEERELSISMVSILEHSIKSLEKRNKALSKKTQVFDMILAERISNEIQR